MTTHQKNVLFMLRQPPYGSSHALEAIEAALVAGVFEQHVSVLFRDDGIWQIIRGQQGSELGTRSVGRVATALPEYDVAALFACKASMQKRGLRIEELALPVKLLDAAEQRLLLSQQDLVVND